MTRKIILEQSGWGELELMEATIKQGVTLEAIKAEFKRRKQIKHNWKKSPNGYQCASCSHWKHSDRSKYCQGYYSTGAYKLD